MKIRLLFFIVLSFILTNCEDDKKIYVQPGLTLYATIAANNSISFKWTKTNFSKFTGTYKIYRYTNYSDNYITSSMLESGTLIATITDRNTTSYIDQSLSYSMSSYSYSYYLVSGETRSNTCNFAIINGQIQVVGDI